MNRDLMAMAIAELKRVHEEELDFFYGGWGQAHLCKTEACAGGYLALFKPFQDLGLGHVAQDDLEPTFGGLQGSRALAKFLGLDEIQASDAFIWLDADGVDKDVCDITALDVANKLQEYLDAEAVSS